MANYSLNDIFCPPSYNGESRRARWFFLGLLVFIGFMIIFILIGLAAGLWRHKQEPVQYLILSRQWPITKCLAKQCNNDFSKQKQWLVNGLMIGIEGENIQKNCQHEQNDFEPKSIDENMKKYFEQHWPNLDQLPIEPTKPTEPTKSTEKTTKKSTTEKPMTETTTPTQPTTEPSTSSTGKSLNNYLFQNYNQIKTTADQLDHNEQLWSNQWQKYGRCYNGKQSDYFAKIMELDENYPLTEKLSEKIEPNSTKLIDLNILAKTLAQKFNNNPKQTDKDHQWNESMFEFVCKSIINYNDDDESIQYLYLLEEIRMCFTIITITDDKDKDKEKQVSIPIECFDSQSYTNESPNGCFGQQMVIYPDLF